MALYIFDLDGTLISSYMDTPDRRYGDWHVLPGRRERLADLHSAGHAVAVVTNQAGVAFGYVSESQARRKIAAALDALGLPADTPVAVCFAHPQARAYRYRSSKELARRKPSGAMLREMIERVGAQGRVQYIGDSPEDRQAARDAGVSFTWAADFFADDDDDGVMDDDGASDD